MNRLENKSLTIAAICLVCWVCLQVGGQPPDTAEPSSKELKTAPLDTLDSILNARIGRQNVLFIDRDGDGYGVACKLGPDADDGDPEVNTPQTWKKKHGRLEAFLAHKGYRPRRIFHVRSNQLVTTRSAVEVRDYTTWDKLRRVLRPGDAAVFHAGTYKGKHVLSCSKLSGSDDKPILIMAYPGEKVVLDGSVVSLEVKHSAHLIFDGFVLDRSGKSSHAGMYTYENHHIVYRNLEVKNHYRGWLGSQDLHYILAENSVFHDNLASHGIYLGAREKVCSNITLRGNLIYRSGRHGIQFNGRIRNFRVASNVIHSNNYGGLSLVNGVSESVVRGNLIFNNNRQGVILHLYDDTPKSGILPYDQANNLIEDNVIWIGFNSWQGDDTEPRDHAAFEMNDSTAARAHGMADNVIRKNVLVTHRGPVFRFSRPRFAEATKVADNIVYRALGAMRTTVIGGDAYSFSAYESRSEKTSRNTFREPKFADVSISYYNKPEAFDFSLD